MAPANPTPSHCSHPPPRTIARSGYPLEHANTANDKRKHGEGGTRDQVNPLPFPPCTSSEGALLGIPALLLPLRSVARSGVPTGAGPRIERPEALKKEVPSKRTRRTETHRLTTRSQVRFTQNNADLLRFR